MVKNKTEILNWLKGVIKKIHQDPDLIRDAEEYQKKYGTFTAEDLREQFTI